MSCRYMLLAEFIVMLCYARTYSVRHRSQEREGPDWQTVAGPVYNKFTQKKVKMGIFIAVD